MLTGAVPFHDENPMTVIHMHLQAQVPPLPQTIPFSVQQIVRRALEKDPSRRYQSAGEMMQHCQQVFAEVTQGGMSIGPGAMPKTMIAPGPPGGPMPGGQIAHPQIGGPHPGGPVAPNPYPGPNMPASMPPGHGMPGMPPPGMGQPGLPGMPPAAGAQQKTMIATPSPFAAGANPGMPQGPYPGSGPVPGQAPAFTPASANQKTIVSMAAPAIPMMQPGGMPPGGMPPGGMPHGMAQPGMPHGGMPHGMGPMGPGGMPPGMGPMGPGGMPHGMAQPGFGLPPGGPGGPAKTVMLNPSEGVVSIAASGPVQPAGTGPIDQGATTLFWIVSLVVGVAVGALAYVIVLQL
jgi:SWI/SNF-related matrix-associated actin-dependent regulator of chromatin subfamily E protein 1